MRSIKEVTHDHMACARAVYDAAFALNEAIERAHNAGLKITPSVAWNYPNPPPSEPSDGLLGGWPLVDVDVFAKL